MIPKLFHAFPDVPTKHFVLESKAEEHWETKGNAVAQVLGFWSLMLLREKSRKPPIVKKK